MAVVEHGSFTAGAVALSTTPSVLSRAVSRLEARLGRQLLQRTTRRVGLTDAGRLYLEQVRTPFAMLDGAERDVQGQDGALAGRVRLSVPTTYGHYRLPPVLARFAQQYSQVQVELNITNLNVDLVAEGLDPAIRLGQLPDSGLLARKLEGLARSSIETSDDVLGVMSLAEQGIGICQSYEFIVRERLQRGQLVEVLPQLRGRSRPFSVIYAPHRRQSAAARAMIELLVGNGSVVEDGVG